MGSLGEKIAEKNTQPEETKAPKKRKAASKKVAKTEVKPEEKV